jgi:1-deoxy-D-xylulose-5-phosphate reductoisomerase
VLNAADEVAVAAFLEDRLPFGAIPELVERTLEAVPSQPVRHFDDLFAADGEARQRGGGLVTELAAA